MKFINSDNIYLHGGKMDNLTFIARVRKRGKVYEVTIPQKVLKLLSLSHGSIIQLKIEKVIYVPEK